MAATNEYFSKLCKVDFRNRDKFMLVTVLDISQILILVIVTAVLATVETIISIVFRCKC